MADIDVTFATNAASAAKQIDGAAVSTTKAGAAANSHTKAVLSEASAMSKAAAAANAQAVAERKLAIESSKAEAVRRQTNAKAGAFLGVGRSMGGAQALLGVGASTAALVGATAAMSGIMIAVELLSKGVEKWWNAGEENNKRLVELNKTLESATAAKGDRGVAAAGAFGPQIRGLAAMGGDGRELADKYTGGFGFADAGSAVLKASSMFPDNYASVLEEANDAAKIAGTTLTAMVENFKGMTTGTFNNFGMAGAAGVGIATGRAVGQGQYLDMASRVESSQDVGNLDRISAAHGQMDLLGISDMSQGSIKAFSDLEEATNAQIEAAKKVTEAFNETVEAAKKTSEFYEKMGSGSDGYGY